MDVDKLLSSSYELYVRLSIAEWEKVSNALLDHLALELNVPLVCTGAVLPKEGEEQPGLAMSFQSATLDRCGLGIRLEGVLGGQVDPGETRFDSSVFVFAGEHRLTSEKGHYMEFEWREIGGASGWVRQGWLKDIYGEFEHVKTWGQTAEPGV